MIDLDTTISIAVLLVLVSGAWKLSAKLKDIESRMEHQHEAVRGLWSKLDNDINLRIGKLEQKISNLEGRLKK